MKQMTEIVLGLALGAAVMAVLMLAGCAVGMAEREANELARYNACYAKASETEPYRGDWLEWQERVLKVTDACRR